MLYVSRSSRPARAPWALTFIAVVTMLLAGLPMLTGTASAATVRYVAPTGSDSNAGTVRAPFRTLRKALTTLRAGDTLLVRGGTYPERIRNPTISAGTATAPIRVQAYPGERPVVQGLLWLRSPSFWQLSGINVTWSGSNTSAEHMVKLTGGTGWTFSGAEVWGARSFAAVLVAGSPTNWRIRGNYIHDTYPSNGTNQDHLIYANTGPGGSGVIERNVLANSLNGRAVKVGPPSAKSGAVANITIRYNTMSNNRGPSNVQVAWRSSNTKVYRNIMVRPGARRSAVTAHQLTGTGNVVSHNLTFNAVRASDAVTGLANGGGNVSVDPKFTNVTGGNYRPLNPAAASYGRFAR